MRPGRYSYSCVRAAVSHLLPDGKINPILAEARARGVIFDVGHGAGSFWFRNAVPASGKDSFRTRFRPICIPSTYTVLSMTQVMSKFLAMGVPLNEIIRRSTVNPAREFAGPSWERCRSARKPTSRFWRSSTANSATSIAASLAWTGNGQVMARMTVRAGRILYDPSGLSMVRVGESSSAIFQRAGI